MTAPIDDYLRSAAAMMMAHDIQDGHPNRASALYERYVDRYGPVEALAIRDLSSTYLSAMAQRSEPAIHPLLTEPDESRYATAAEYYDGLVDSNQDPSPYKSLDELDTLRIVH